MLNSLVTTSAVLPLTLMAVNLMAVSPAVAAEEKSETKAADTQSAAAQVEEPTNKLAEAVSPDSAAETASADSDSAQVDSATEAEAADDGKSSEATAVPESEDHKPEEMGKPVGSIDDSTAEVATDGAADPSDSTTSTDSTETKKIPEPLPENAGPVDRWVHFLKGEVVRLKHLDPYGATFQIPQGYLALGWNRVQLSLGGRFDENGDYGPVIKPLEFTLGDEKQLDVLLDAQGEGGGHTFRLGYGIIENVSGFIEVPFSFMDLRVTPIVRPVDDEGNMIGETVASLIGVQDRKAYDAATFLYDTLPKLGRPALATRFKGEWLLGDVQLGLNWNYFRGKYYSSGFGSRLYLPTGRVPPPNQDLFYATGPEIQVGQGGWGAGISHVFDVRLLNNFHGVTLVYTAELGGNYYFKQKREYPTNFVEPDPGAGGLSPDQFPDLSELSVEFTYTPGLGVQMGHRLSVGWGPIGIGTGIVMQHTQKPYFDADPRFVSMVNSLGLTAQSSGVGFVATGSVNLLAVGVPIAVMVEYQRVLSGRNMIVFDDYIKVGVDMIGPLFLLWN